MKEIRETRDELLERREALERRLAAIRADYARGLDADFEEQAIQLENAEVLEALARQADEELQAINAKLAALDAS